MAKPHKLEASGEPSFERDIAEQFVAAEGNVVKTVRYFDSTIRGDKNVAVLRTFFFVLGDNEAYCNFRDCVQVTEKNDIWCKYKSRRLIRLHTFNHFWGELSPLWHKCHTESGFFQGKWVDVKVLPPRWSYSLSFSGLEEALDFGELRILQTQWKNAVGFVEESPDEDA